jgi:hypothetical protein
MNITTRGDQAYGIQAQSLGGGGGKRGIGGGSTSPGKGGDGGKVTVDWQGDIVTSGANSALLPPED